MNSALRKSLIGYSFHRLRYGQGLPFTCLRTCQFSKESKDLPPCEGMENPFSRTMRVLKDDLKYAFSKEQRKFFPHVVDIAIIGGGIYGSSIAYWLKQKAPSSFTQVVIEKDTTFSCCSTTLSVGGLRQQFSLPENIELSLASAEFLRNIKKHLCIPGEEPPDIQFQPTGYLFLSNEAGLEQMKANYEIQKELGAKVELLTAKQLKENFPWLNTDNIVLGSHGLENEGRFDPWLLLKAFQKKSISLGTEFLEGEVIGFEFKKWDETFVGDDENAHHRVNQMLVKLPNGEIKKIAFGILVIAAGSLSGEVAKMLRIGTGKDLLRYPLPVEPRKRYVYVVHCPNGPSINIPLTIDPSGIYVVREGLGGNFLTGRSPTPENEPDITDKMVDYSFFDNYVWPLLAKRVPAFEALKVKSGWTGYYDYNYFDQNGIIGLHPYYNNVYFATGFSGHGIQMAPAVGRAIMEHIIYGDYQTIDVSRFAFDRIIEGKPLYEKTHYLV